MGEFPFLDVPRMGGGMVIAAIAVFHVILAHYAVGTGLLLYAFERADRDGIHAGIQRMIELLGKSVIYLNFVIGAISGVGIWFAISLYSPDATQHLIQKFVWLWATEWTFFAVEIAVGYLYYYRRAALAPAARRRLAGIYALFTWGSLLVITGILSYMLTSKEGNALVAWNNASAWPSVMLRTLSAVALACLVVLLLSAIRPLFAFARDSAEEQGVYRVVYRLLQAFFLLLPLALWYRLTIPDHSASWAEGSSIPISMFLAATVFFSLLVTVVAWYALRRGRPLQAEAAFLLLAMGIATTFTAEFVREGIRKPYIIYPVLYSNGIWTADLAEWQRRAAALGSVLAVDRLYLGTPRERVLGAWQVPATAALPELSATERGEYLYRAQCMICHTREGFNRLDHLTRAWSDTDYAAGVVRNLHLSKPFMPPFVGTERDIADLVAYLRTLNPGEAAHGQ